MKNKDFGFKLAVAKLAYKKGIIAPLKIIKADLERERLETKSKLTSPKNMRCKNEVYHKN